MSIDIPGVVLLMAAFGVSGALSLLTYQVRELNKFVRNGMSKDIEVLKESCYHHHGTKFR